jgi:hypothetical protein
VRSVSVDCLYCGHAEASIPSHRLNFEQLLNELQVAVVSIWEPLPHPPLRAAACRFARTKQCSRRSTECLASGPSVSRLTRPIRRMLSRYSSLMVTLHGNLSRCYKAMSALRPDGVSRHFMSAGGFERVVLGVVLVMSISGASYTAPSCKCSNIGTAMWLFIISPRSFLCMLTPLCDCLLVGDPSIGAHRGKLAFPGGLARG